jgi:hypothetical protein
MFVTPNFLFGIGVTIVRGIVTPLFGSLLLLALSKLTQRFDLFPHLSERSLDFVHPFALVSVGILGIIIPRRSAILSRTVGIPLPALSSVMRLLYTGRMHGAKLTELLMRTLLICRQIELAANCL